MYLFCCIQKLLVIKTCSKYSKVEEDSCWRQAKSLQDQLSVNGGTLGGFMSITPHVFGEFLKYNYILNDIRFSAFQVRKYYTLKQPYTREYKPEKHRKIVSVL